MKQGDAKISVIIPCYNVAAYIDRCVESIIYQDYGMQNLELILIDDRKRFLEKAEERIMQDLTLKNEYINTDMSITAERMHMQESVSLHIRGTDYLQGVNRDIFASQDADYYRNALSVIRERCSGPIHVYVFTDDMDHANTILRDINEDEYEIMPQAESYQDLWLMSQTKHHIIANSSYSFWGARIGEKKEDKGYTVAPKLWFLRMKDPVLYPDDWIVM